MGKIMNIYVNIFPIRTKGKHLDRLFEVVIQFSLIHDREYLYCNTIFDMDWVWNSFGKRLVMLAGIFPEWKIYKYRLFFQMCYCFMFFCRQGLKAKKRVTKLVFVVIIVFIGKFYKLHYTIQSNSYRW
jgi:hypothetical protein